MTKRYLYTSETFAQLTLNEQEGLFSSIDFDLIVSERPIADRPHRAWTGLSRILRTGDFLATASLAVFSYEMPMLNKQLHKLLARGVTIQIGLPDLTISPHKIDAAFQLIQAYDEQMRRDMSQKIKAGLATSVRGSRPSRLTADQLPEVKAMMADPTLTMKDIAAKLQVSRSTIYNFLKKVGST